MSLEFVGKHLEFLHDDTPEIDLEGGRGSGKTIVCLWKELEALRKYPGMWSLICRYSDDATQKLLKPELERVARIHRTDLGDWNNKENAFELPTGSRIFMHGLQTVSPDPEVRYKKIRGLSVSRIYNDQSEELPGDISSELRFPLRPDITARASGRNFPRQLTFSPNPADTSHWLAKQFPVNNSIKGRKYYSLSLYDNAQNLPTDMIESLEQEFPPEHPRHQTLILGQRGPTIIGDPVFDKIFNRHDHRRHLDARTDAPLLEAFEVGKHNPCWVIAQRSHYGGLLLLGGIKGERLMLEDFLPVVKQHRADWFPGARFQSCTSPMGEKAQTKQRRTTLLAILREAGIQARWREDANAPDVQLAMIEQLTSYMRRRTFGREEAFGVNADADRWLVASAEGIAPKPFLSFALDGGYVWDEHFVSVSNQTVRQPKDDDDFANAMKCVENIVLNFCISQPSDYEREERAVKDREQQGGGHSQPTGPNAWMY